MKNYIIKVAVRTWERGLFHSFNSRVKYKSGRDNWKDKEPNRQLTYEDFNIEPRGWQRVKYNFTRGIKYHIWVFKIMIALWGILVKHKTGNKTNTL